MKKQILGNEIPQLTIKESRKIANIIRNDESEVSLAAKMGAASKLHSTVEILNEDVAVVDDSIKQEVKSEVVYTTIFDYGVEDKDKVVYTTDEGKITLVKKVKPTVNIRYKAFNNYMRELLMVILHRASKTDDEDLNFFVKEFEEALPLCSTSFSIDKDNKKVWESKVDDKTLSLNLCKFVITSHVHTPMFDVLYTVKEKGGEE